MPAPIIIIRTYDDLLQYLRAIKDERQLSNEFMDETIGVTRGHTDKVIGPTRVKNLSPMMFDNLLEVLAIELVPRANVAAATRMAERWEQRQGNYRKVDYAHVPNRLSIKLLTAAKPKVIADLARNAGLKSRDGRMSKISPKRRSQISRRAARARWKRYQDRKAAEQAQTCQAHQDQSSNDRNPCATTISAICP